MRRVVAAGPHLPAVGGARSTARAEAISERLVLTGSSDMARQEVARLHSEMEGLRAELRQHREDMKGVLRQKDAELARLQQAYREDMNKKDEAMDKKDEAHRQDMNRLRDDMNKKDEAMDKKDEVHRQDMKDQLERMLQLNGQGMTPAPVQQRQLPPPTLPAMPAQQLPAYAAAPSSQQQRTERNVPTTISNLPERPPTLASADELVTQLQSGDDDSEAALVNVLEMGLDVLEAVLVSTPRKQRRVVKTQCEVLEAMLEEVDSSMLGRLAAYEPTDLARLGRYLVAVQALRPDKAGVECVAVVADAIGELRRCSDVVTGASKQVASAEAGVRLCGMGALAGLPRGLLPKPDAVEVGAASLVLGVALDESKTDAERATAYWALFALGLRNGAAAVEALESFHSKYCHPEVYDGRLQGPEGVAVWIGSCACWHLSCDVACLHPTICRRLDKALSSALGFLSAHVCTKARYQELLPLMLDMTTADDVVKAAAATKLLSIPPLYTTMGRECSGTFFQCDPIRVGWGVRKRVVETGQLATHWQKLLLNLSEDCVCCNLWSYFLYDTVLFMPAIPHDGLWPEIIRESVHLAKINCEAAISSRDGFSLASLVGSFYLMTRAARDSSHHAALMPCAEALLWATSHDNVQFLGGGVSESAAISCVCLLAKNEGGLTLDKNTVDIVLLNAHRYFDTSPTADFMTKQRVRENNGKKIASRVQLIVDMVIADSNKPLVLANHHVLEDLVAGLLLDDTNPRRGQEGADTLQATSAQALENLALSEVGKPVLRSHKLVMEGLRALKQHKALSDEASRSASAALFELDEAARQKAKAAATAAKASGSSSEDDGDADTEAEHVMLSYNWGHQEVVKRINAALKARGYSVWIDIEKMQGSTVEAMSEAVEGAAVMCYGISQAYKESANCRLEAQYAYQQQLDMVPLMLEDGYNAKGWLGMLLGVRLYYKFCGPVLENENAFEGKVEELCRELGEKGKA